MPQLTITNHSELYPEVLNCLNKNASNEMSENRHDKTRINGRLLVINKLNSLMNIIEVIDEYFKMIYFFSPDHKKCEDDKEHNRRAWVSKMP